MMAPRWLSVAVLLGVILGTALFLAAQENGPPSLPPTEACQAEALTLKATVVQLRAQLVQRETELAQLQLERERTRLEGRFRELLKPDAATTFDWTTFTFKPPPIRE